jgi:hypothetical protein
MIRQTGQDRKERVDRTQQPEQDRQNETLMIGLPGQDGQVRQNETPMIEILGLDGQDRTAGTRLPGLGCQHRTARIRQ